MDIKSYEENNLSFIEIINNAHLKLVLCNLGASIYDVYFYNEEVTMQVINSYGFKDPNIYYGKTIGRTANRIKEGKIIIDGKLYQASINLENGNSHHGGSEGLNTKYFNSEIIENENSVDVKYSYTSPHLESGYPGNAKFSITYSINKNTDSFSIIFEAISDMDTMVGLTNHAFWTLASSSIKDLSLFVNSSEYLYSDAKTLLPVEKRKLPLNMSFKELKNINKVNNDINLVNHAAKGVDFQFFYDNNQKPEIILCNNKYQLEISSNFLTAHIYTDNYSNPYPVKHTHELVNRSVAIEPQDDISNRKILKKDEKYLRNITYKFIKKGKEL